MGSNWLVVVDSYSKYPCIHATGSTSTKATIKLLEHDFSHFGYPHCIVSDNASTFKSEEFQKWCSDSGITHLTGAPYHPATNGAAERLVQSFKNALKKSDLPPNEALQQFLMQYRRTPLTSGLSPSELLNGRQIRTKIDTLLPSPAQVAQSKQMKGTNKLSRSTTGTTKSVSKYNNPYKVGMPCYAQYFGRNHNKPFRWVPAVVIKVSGTRSVNVKVHPQGPVWRRHIEQLRPRYGADEDDDPGDEPQLPQGSIKSPVRARTHDSVSSPWVPSPEYGPGNPRRSKRTKKPRKILDL